MNKNRTNEDYLTTRCQFGFPVCIPYFGLLYNETRCEELCSIKVEEPKEELE